MISWLLGKWKEWYRSAEILQERKATEKRLLDEIHGDIRSGRVRPDQLDSVSMCLDDITVNLVKKTSRAKGVAK